MNWRYVLTSYEGRISRRVFLIGLMGLSLASFVALVVVSLLGAAGMPLSLVMGAIVFILIMTVYLSIPPVVKRLHDRDRPGSWAAFYFVPTLLGYGMTALRFRIDSIPLAVASELVNLIGLAASIWLIVDAGILKGTPGPNRYGPDPLAEAAPAPSGAGDVR